MRAKDNGMTYAYVRQLPHFVPLSQQQREIIAFATEHNLTIDKEVVEYSNKHVSMENRKDFEAFMQGVKKGDRLIVSHFAVISQRIDEVIKVINCILSHKATLYICSSKTKVDSRVKLVDVAPILNDLGIVDQEKRGSIGRPKGSRSSSKFDPYYTQIVAMLKEEMSVSAMARSLGVSRSSLKDYIESRELKQMVAGSWMKQVPASQEPENIVLVCPFEEGSRSSHQEKKQGKVS